MEYAKGRMEGQPSRMGEGTFSGRAMLDPLLDDGAAARVRVNSVVFEPGGRTHWHSHTDGQVLLVASGRGMVENRDGDRHVLEPGDLVLGAARRGALARGGPGLVPDSHGGLARRHPLAR